MFFKKEIKEKMEDDKRYLRKLIDEKQYSKISIKTGKFKYFKQYNSYSTPITKEEYLKYLRNKENYVFKTEMIVTITIEELIHLLLDYMGISVKYGFEKRVSEVRKYMIVKRKAGKL